MNNGHRSLIKILGNDYDAFFKNKLKEFAKNERNFERFIRKCRSNLQNIFLAFSTIVNIFIPE